MEDYQQRVVDEHAALSQKLSELEDFFFSHGRSDLSAKEQALLSAQIWAMVSYKGILEQRIALFG